MSNTTSSNPASLRIANLLDEGSFVEIGGQVTARATDFNMQEKKAPTDGLILLNNPFLQVSSHL